MRFATGVRLATGVGGAALLSLASACAPDEEATSAPEDVAPPAESPPDDDDGDDHDGRDGDAPGEPPPGGDDTGEVDPRLEPLVETAVADLADRLGAGADDIEVLVAETVVWSDPSLGCPQPGMRYRQLPQDGARVRLEHDGRTYDYHAGGDRPEPFLCEQPERDPAPGGDIDI